MNDFIEENDEQNDVRIPVESKPHIWLDPTLGWNFCYSAKIWKVVNVTTLKDYTEYMDQQHVKRNRKQILL